MTPEESGSAPGGTPCDAPGDASGGVEDPAAPASMPRPATQAVLQPDPAAGLSRRAPAPEVREAGAGAVGVVGGAEAAEDDFSSVGLLRQWSASTMDIGRHQAIEAAQLAAFVLARLLNRHDGAERLERFLSVPAVLGGDDGEAADAAEWAEEDPRLTARAGELLDTDVLVILSARSGKAKRAVVRHQASVAVVWFLGFHNLLASIAQGRLPFARIARRSYRVDDALLPLPQVQALDRYLNSLPADLSMDQFEKLSRHRIRSLDPIPPDPEAPRRGRRVQLERCDDDSGILTLTGPIEVLDALFQRTRATARAIRRKELSALGLPQADGGSPAAVEDLERRITDERTIAHLMFDLLAGSRPRTQVRVRDAGAGASDAATLFGGPATDGSAPADEFVEVLCPTDGAWLRKQAAVHVTVPVSTLLGMNDAPGRGASDATLSAQKCREIASHATSWVRILTDPATGAVTDDIAQTYEPPAAMRRTVRQKWRTCTAPGCSQPAENCEIDHARSFNHLDPATGGLTVVDNLHPLCTHHHQLKTAGVIGLRTISSGELVWVLPMGVTATAVPPPVAELDDLIPPQALLDRAREADAVAAGGSVR